MRRQTRDRPDFAATASFWMLVGFLILLWFSGGASRADVGGQVVTRVGAWGLLVASVLILPRVDWRPVQPLAIIVAGAILLVALQLVPLPPIIWTALPGRTLLEQVAIVTDQQQPWRPISLSPGATVNALGSLVVPVTVLMLAANQTREQHWRLVGVLLVLIVAGCVIGLLQFSGARYDNPLINDIRGLVSANFANRNHFALFVAIGCVLAPVWGFHGEEASRWKAISAISLLPLFVLIVLATGSRAGTLLVAIATIFGYGIVRRQALGRLRLLPRSVAVGLVIAIVAGLILAIGLSISLDRAVSVTRAVDLQADEDLRRQALPYVLEAVGRYFPVGSGFGAFDPVYRIVEPDELLSTQYFNHAHNDWLEIVLDGGAAAILLAAASLFWWLAASVRAWRGGTGGTLAKAGSATILLVFLASLVDYPARTPMIMTVLVLAGVWLAGGQRAAQEMRAVA